MRKIFLFLLFFGLFFAISNQTSLAANGEDCKAAGGSCKTACGQGEIDDGPWDCLKLGRLPNTCCLPAGTTPTQLSCGSPCTSVSQCPDECKACMPEYQGGPNICRDAAVPQITPPGPGGGEGGSIRTAIGDIDPHNLQSFIQQLLNLALGVAGGIAFLLMLFGAFQIMTSAGNPEKMKSGSELITSALTGLLFIIFSVFILKLIGVEILQIPGFGK